MQATHVQSLGIYGGGGKVYTQFSAMISGIHGGLGTYPLQIKGIYYIYRKYFNQSFPFI